ncbi:hypothetical protein [Actinokineospora fastidiosa]|uniref:Uncharacterized protein n=1 Tax=Actinokineospora fastidiosa TaxID=1816 RepID=A0A918GRH0_9PSEU|nr:hypothetical protein [Actinokineospora fastidiosa]GGS55910.1 hypothetical protein GCM10010171_58570 [Actinokineospora fastidiosa]
MRDIVIGLLADPDLPAALAERLSADLPERLGEPAATVDTAQDPFESMYPDHGRLMDKATERIRATSWDLAICITDLPIRSASGPVLASVDPASRVAVVSLPALGGVRLLSRLRSVVLPLIRALAERRVPSELPGLRVLAPDPEDGTVEIVWPGRFHRTRLLAGMVRANRPWQLILGLSRALASAMTGVAFGVLYSTIWALATALHPLRLAALTVATIAAMTVWLIAGHRLWESRSRATVVPDPQVRLRNASTAITVAVGTFAFFTALFAIALAAVAIVVPPAYLETTLGHPVGVGDYVTIALMASALGTLAGAVGSGLEDDTTVRLATYGYREQERRERVED